MIPFAGSKLGLTVQDLLRVVAGNAVNYWDELNSGKFNHTQYENGDYMGNYAAPFNPLETKWNYRNMHETLQREREAERLINEGTYER